MAQQCHVMLALTSATSKPTSEPIWASAKSGAAHEPRSRCRLKQSLLETLANHSDILAGNRLPVVASGGALPSPLRRLETMSEGQALITENSEV